MTLTRKNKIKKIAAVTFLICLLAASMINAQSADYENAFGVRIGGTSGLTYKHKFSGGNGLEVILSGHPGITGLYEKHFDTKASGLNWYVGGGAHVAQRRTAAYFWVRKDDRYYYYNKTYYYGTVFGLDLVAGLEYKIPSAPLAFSFDVKPMVEFYNDDRAYMYLDPSLGVKIAF